MKYILRDYQEQAVTDGCEFFISEKEKDGAVIVMPTGCHAKGTKVVMFNGSTKKVEDINIGDVLMGPDSSKRNVVRVISGNEEMYKITPHRGDSFIVNENHILSLQTTNEGDSKRIKNRHKNASTGQEIDNISVSEYLKKSKWWKHLRKLRKTKCIEFCDNNHEYPLDPWLLGILIGDGCLIYHPTITNPDQDIIDNVKKTVKIHGVEIHYKKTNHQKTCKEISLCDGSHGKKGRPKNIIRQKLEHLNLWGKKSGEKFIPFIYKTGSVETRLNILAGLLDSDGHLNKGLNFDFISKSKQLSEDVTFVCRSLGLMASCKKVRKGCQNGYSNYYWRVCISGELSIIPNKCSRKKHNLPRKQKKDVLKTGFKIEPVGIGKFYGFELDNDHLYITDDFFIHHNSGKSLIIASIAKRMGGRTIVFQPSREILDQNYKKAVEFGFKDIGIYSASMGRKDIGQITFSTIGTAISKKHLFEDFDRIIIDECHNVNAKGGMYEEFIKHFGGKVLGLTATPYRMTAYRDAVTDERRVVARFLTRTRPRIFTKIVHVTQVEDLYNKGFLCPIQYSFNKDYDQSKIALNSTGMDFNEQSLKTYNDEVKLVQKTYDVIKKEKLNHVLVFNSSVKEAESLSEKLRAKNVVAVTISAKTPKKERELILEKFRSGEINVVSNVGVLTTGFDFPELDGIILARPTQSVALYYQMIGRGVRIAKGKKCTKVIDLCGNVKRFGMVEMFKIIEPKKNLHRLESNAGFLTGFDFVANENVEKSRTEIISAYSDNVIPDVLTFGKYKGTHIKKVPSYYMEWCVKNMGAGAVVNKFKKELDRRDVPKVVEKEVAVVVPDLGSLF